MHLLPYMKDSCRDNLLVCVLRPCAFLPEERFVWSYNCRISGSGGRPCVHCNMLMG